MSKVSVEKSKCTKCGLCITDCVAKCLVKDKENYPVLKYPDRCIECQHCFMICPNGALMFNDANPVDSVSADFDNILNLIKSRRSIRQYKNEEFTEDEWNKIKEILPYIPTGCNSHKLHFALVENKSVMEELKNRVNSTLLKLLNNKVLSPIVKHFEVYKDSFENGDDIIFRNAPHMIVVSSPISAPCAPQDPIIALSYIELYAQSLGYGTCWCGYAALCIKIFPELCEILEIPKGYTPVYAMLLGKPAVKYHRMPQPKPYKISEIKELIPKMSCIWCKIKRIITNFIRG